LREGDTYLKQGLPQKAIDAWNAAIKQCDLTTSQRATLNSRIRKAECYNSSLQAGIVEYNAGNNEVAKAKWQSALNCSNLTDSERQILMIG
jgi:predicted negative regulator of RcsB-dependent stress response